MSVDIEERLSSIRKKQQAAAFRKARAEAQAEEAAERRDNALARLLNEFGCEDIESGQRKLEEMQAETEASLKAIEEKVQGL